MEILCDRTDVSDTRIFGPVVPLSDVELLNQFKYLLTIDRPEVLFLVSIR